MKLSPYKPLKCDNVVEISVGIYNFLADNTTLLTSGAFGWHFINIKQLMKQVPLLTNFFVYHKLAVRSASVIILYETGQLPLHVDELPVIAKVNFPVCNTVGWSNRWFGISEEELSKLPLIENQFGTLIEDLSGITLPIIAELSDMSYPIVFNSRIPHDVVKLSACELPRVIASFNFYNEPLRFLT